MMVITVTIEGLSNFEKQLNFRTRKCMGYRQPQMVFDKWHETIDF